MSSKRIEILKKSLTISLKYHAFFKKKCLAFSKKLRGNCPIATIASSPLRERPGDLSRIEESYEIFFR
jgi:hypothetical protein